MTNLAATVAAIQDAKDQISILNDKIEALYSSIPESQVVGDHVAGDYILKVTANRRFDAALAQKTLPASTYKKILISKPDTTLAKKYLTGDQYEKAQRVIGVTRKIVAVTDED